jgi:predicted ATPase/class 3 adenylate cyclase
MRELPTGTVTFLFSDIEGSTRLLHELGRRYGDVLEEHRRLLREAFTGRGGVEVDTQGDAFFYAFPRASGALLAAAEAQHALVATPVRVRIGIHTGEPSRSAEGYVGADLHRAARIMAAAHGGQVLVSEATRGLIADDDLEGLALRDLGEHRLKDLTRPQRLHQLVIAGLPSEFPPPRTLEGRPTNLPIQLTALVGRNRELAELGQVLHRPDVRLLTLTGPGGTGKTRLALQLAADVLEDFPDGVFVVSLAPLADPSLALPAIAQTLGVRESAGRPVAAVLRDYVAEKRVLLVLDNFEQVVEAAGEVSDLLEAGPDLKVLVTTREPLHIPGEQEWPVQPLELPRAAETRNVEVLSQYESVRLFIERARAVRPDFTVTNENAPAVAEICVRLDGLPLAIELAAARVKVLSVSDLLGRLDQRLAVLTGGGRTTPERQRTLRGAIDWSYSLLDGKERTLFARLSVFAGGCTLDAAEAICEADLDTLAALVDKSLIRETDGAGDTRFSMLETIREYAVERLGESEEADAVRHRQADYYVALAEEAQEPLRGEGRREWAARLDQEQDNVRAVLEWSLARTEPVRPLKIASAIWYYWMLRGQLTEGRRWIERALDCGDPAPSPLRAWSLGIAGEFLRAQGEAEAAIAVKEEALGLAEKLGDKRDAAALHHDLGEIAATQGDLPRARTHHERALALRQELGTRWGIAHALSGLVDVSVRDGDYASARELAQEVHEFARDENNEEALIWALGMLGDIERRAGNLERARELFAEALSLSVESGDRPRVAEMLEGTAALAGDAGDPLRAARLWGAAGAIYEEIGMAIWDLAEHERCVGAARQKMGEERFRAAWEEGRSMHLENAVACALGAKTSDQEATA